MMTRGDGVVVVDAERAGAILIAHVRVGSADSAAARLATVCRENGRARISAVTWAHGGQDAALSDRAIRGAVLRAADREFASRWG